jgi:CRISPR-associated endonuclease Csn1
LLLKNELRQPIIEKILNQMINIVNALKEQHGNIDEVRVELARELKQSKDERAHATERINKNERENKTIEERIKEYGVRPSRARIQKYKMWIESQERCFYCNTGVSATEFLSGADVEVEHIIPRSVLFDDSFSNKVCACRACNHAKGNMTAREFMETRSQAELEAYLSRVNTAFEEGRISKTKRDHLLWRKDEIPQDFIDRQLRQSQYIAKKAVEILRSAIRDVYATSGNVTDFLRHIWGYDQILHQLNLPKYRDAELTEWVTYDHRGQEHQEERIKNWSKRIDHRHHAIDALTIALTRQGYIQRLNNLNASHDDMAEAVRKVNPLLERKYSLLEKYLYIQPHFSVQEVTNAVDGILVSFRAGKKVTTPAKRAIYRKGKRINVQTDIQVPRGALTEETVYGKVGNKYVVKYPLVHPSMKVDDIVDPTIREIVRNRLTAFGGKAKEAFAKPLYSDAAQKMEIKSVRCYTGLQDKAVAAVRFNDQGEAVGFSKTGNNHHIAIYQDMNGQYQESVVSFWQAVERKRYGLPIVIEDSKSVWDKVMNMDLPQEFLETLPKDDWQFVVSLQANEMFILGLEDADFEMAMENRDYQLLNKYLYRVQKLATKNYAFRHHIETSVDDKYDGVKKEMLSKQMKKLKITQSFDAFFAQHPHKVRVNLLGEISLL